MGFYKNGVISNNINESVSNALMRNRTIKYTPAADTTNSCMDTLVGENMPSGTKYHYEVTVSWGDFESLADNFFAWFQGAQKHKDAGWGWTGDNPMGTAMGYGALKTWIKDAPSGGTKHLSGTFTVGANYVGYRIGCRADYSDGKGWIQMGDMTVIPEKDYGIKIYENEIITDNFIEC